MPRTVDNIGFYSRLGLVPGPLTVTLVHDVPRRAGAAARAALGARAASSAQRIEECRRLTDALAPGVDFTREIALTRDLGIGDTTLVRDAATLRGVRALALDAARGRAAEGRGAGAQAGGADLGAFDRLLDALHGTAAAERVGRIAIRCQTEFAEAYLRLIAAGYRVHWTDLRMMLGGFPQRPPRHGSRHVELGDLNPPCR